MIEVNEHDGRVAVVTGGSGAIGAAVTERLRNAGALVHVLDIQPSSLSGAYFHRVDVGDETEVDAAFDSVGKSFGRIDYLVCCAAIYRPAPFLELRLEDWQRTLQINLTGYFLCCHGDTAKVPYGNGSNASRSTVMAGSAAVGASRKVKDKLLQLASASLEIDSADLILRDGHIVVRGALERSLSFSELARLALPGPALKSGITPGISEEDFFATDKRPFPYGVHIASVEVDKEIGKIKILDYLVTEDVGRKINPMIIEGQMAGGLAQGIGGAMLEEFVYDEDGQPLSTNFMRSGASLKQKSKSD